MTRPTLTSDADLAEEFSVQVRTIRQWVRECGAGYIRGPRKSMLFDQQQRDQFLRLRSANARPDALSNPPSSAPLSAEDAYEKAMKLAKKKTMPNGK